MPINIYSVSNHLESVGWRLLSDSYKNLDSELEMVCPQGHVQKQTYKEWRKHMLCQQCMAGDPYKIKNKVPPKDIKTQQRVLALDAATNTSGYAIFDDEELIHYGAYTTEQNNDHTVRINEVKHWLEKAVKEWQIDAVAIENIQLQRSNGYQNVEVYKVLAELQGVLLDTLFELQIPYELVYSASWRNYCGIGDGRGRENKKKAAQEAVKRWYKQDCTQDEADAICIGKYYVNNKKSGWGEQLYD